MGELLPTTKTTTDRGFSGRGKNGKLGDTKQASQERVRKQAEHDDQVERGEAGEQESYWEKLLGLGGK